MSLPFRRSRWVPTQWQPSGTLHSPVLPTPAPSATSAAPHADRHGSRSGPVVWLRGWTCRVHARAHVTGPTVCALPWAPPSRRLTRKAVTGDRAVMGL